MRWVFTVMGGLISFVIEYCWGFMGFLSFLAGMLWIILIVNYYDWR